MKILRMDRSGQAGLSLLSAKPKASGFTLVELLVVISIIMVLIAILMPALKHSRTVTHLTMCKNNLRQIYISSTAYALDNKERFPDKLTSGGISYRAAPGIVTPGGTPEIYGWPTMLNAGNYLPAPSKTWICPGNPVNDMAEYGNSYATSVAGTLDTLRLGDLKMQTTLLVWDNYNFKPAVSGTLTSGGTIPSAQQQYVHRVGHVKNIASSVVRLYGSGQVIYVPEDL